MAGYIEIWSVLMGKQGKAHFGALGNYGGNKFHVMYSVVMLEGVISIDFLVNNGNCRGMLFPRQII